MNLWFFLIAVSDSCAIIGSMMKMLIDVNVTELLWLCVLDKSYWLIYVLTSHVELLY